jgi:hypothetical protein
MRPARRVGKDIFPDRLNKKHSEKINSTESEENQYGKRNHNIQSAGI